MKRNKSGISLIVLVITVIVMIILAGSVIISLSNSGIIGKANEAVDANNLKQVEQLAALAWAEAYIDKIKDSTVDIKARVQEVLTQNKVDTKKYIINVTDNGVEVIEPTALGNLISDPTVDYGKLVDYEANGVTEWQVLYEDETNGYVFLISKNSVATVGAGYDNITEEQTKLYNIFKLGQTGFPTMKGYVANLVKNYGDYANTEDYGDNVIGAIGGPTIELIAAGYNAYHNNTAIIPIVNTSFMDEESGMQMFNGANGYFINEEGKMELTGLVADGIYMSSCYWLASPSAYDGWNVDYCLMTAGSGGIGHEYVTGVEDYIAGIRPVVCLKSSIPAIATETGYSLVK